MAMSARSPWLSQRTSDVTADAVRVVRFASKGEDASGERYISQYVLPIHGFQVSRGNKTIEFLYRFLVWNRVCR